MVKELPKPTIRRVTEAERRERMRILTTAERAALPTKEERERRAREAKEAIEKREAEIAEEEREIIEKPPEIIPTPPPEIRRGPAITQAIQERVAAGVPTQAVVEAQRRFEEKQRAVSERIPTLEAIQEAGREFAEARPTVARAVFRGLEVGAEAARIVVPEEVGVPVGEFAVGAFRGLQEEPLKAAAFFGATLALGPTIRGAAALARVTGVSPVLAPVAQRIQFATIGRPGALIYETVTPAIKAAPTVALGGLFGVTAAQEIRAPVIENGFERPPTPAEMAQRAGRIYSTEIVPIVAGVGVAQKLATVDIAGQAQKARFDIEIQRIKAQQQVKSAQFKLAELRAEERAEVALVPQLQLRPPITVVKPKPQIVDLEQILVQQRVTPKISMEALQKVITTAGIAEIAKKAQVQITRPEAILTPAQREELLRVTEPTLAKELTVTQIRAIRQMQIPMQIQVPRQITVTKPKVRFLPTPLIIEPLIPVLPTIPLFPRKKPIIKKKVKPITKVEEFEITNPLKAFEEMLGIKGRPKK